MFTQNLNDKLRKFTNEKLILLLISLMLAHHNKKNTVELVSHCIGLYHNYWALQIQDRHIILSQFIIIIHSGVLSLKGFPIEPILIVEIFRLIDLHFTIQGID